MNKLTRRSKTFYKNTASVVCATSLQIVLAALAQNAMASCKYTIDNEWNAGFVATVAITNDTTSTINSWSINWNYNGSDRVSNHWNATLNGNNPYTASNTSGNGTLAPGQTTTFGFVGSKSSAAAETPTINGDLCGSVTEPPPPTPTEGVFRVDTAGNITKNGNVIPMQCGSWFGLEGQHEPKDAANNADGAPMELNVGNMWWADTGRDIQQTMDDITAMGINVVRLPIAPQTLDPTNPQGIGDIRNGGVLKNHPSVQQTNSRQAMVDFIKQAERNNIEVIIDIHSCSNYVGWRAGRLDASPPWVDADRIDYDYTREGYSCNAGDSVTVQAYNETLWLENLREIAGLSKELGVGNILGIDIFNEPWDYTWEEWKTLAEKAYEAINAVNPDVLIVVEGVGSEKGDGTKVPHGDEDSNPNWGENFFGYQTSPLNIPKEKLIVSPHTYGPSVFVQRQFMDPTQPQCTGLEGDDAGRAKCNVVINPVKLKQGWDEHFGYLRDQGYAVVLGEFGGNTNWPQGTRQGERDLWAHITTPVDGQWQNVLVDYMVEKKIQGCYWSINPESGDTGGLYLHSYDPVSNTAGWGTWLGFDTTKWTLLKRLWNQ